MKLILTVIVLLACISCNSRESATDMITIPVYNNLGSIPIEIDSKSFKYKNVSLTPLESGENSYLGDIRIAGINDSLMVLTSNNQVYLFDSNTGNFISSFDHKGRGPKEYLSLFSSVVDFPSRIINIHDMFAKKIVKYSLDGDFIDKLDNDSIIWLASTDENYFAFNHPKSATKYQFGVYDKDWRLIKSTLTKPQISKNSNRMYVAGMLNHLNTIYTTMNDTTFIFDDKFNLDELFVIDKGKYKCPLELASDIRNTEEMESYITSDYVYILGNNIFYSYMYMGKKYQELWDIPTQKLIYRNIMNGTMENYAYFRIDENSVNGIPIEYKGKIIYSGDPIYQKENKVYFLIDQIYANELELFDYEIDNPVIMTVSL